MLPIKAFNDQGTTTVEPLIKAVRFAADNGAKVVNMSLSYTRTPIVEADVSAFQDAINQYLIARNITVVGAMGNFGRNPDRSGSPLPPSNFDSVIAVGATVFQVKDGDGRIIDNPRELLGSISSRGSWVSVVAPGQNVHVITGFETSDCGQKDPNTGRDLGFFCGLHGDRRRSSDGREFPYRVEGSSFAAPIVSGVASLVLGCHPTYTPSQVRGVIQNSADKIGESAYVNGRNEFYGFGRVNALKALQTAAALSRVGASWTRPANATTRLFIPIGVRARGFDGALTC